MFVYAFVITGGLGALIAAAVLLRHVLVRRSASRRTAIAAIVYALAALAGAAKFCYDLVANWHLWSDDSTAIALLNFIGIIMINSFSLLLVVAGCVWLTLSNRPNKA